MSEEIRTKRKYSKRSTKIAYTFPLPFGTTLEVKESANAWWMDPGKLHGLALAFQNHFTIEQACLFTHITEKQYKYFVSLHPEFAEAREGYRLAPAMQAHITIIQAIKNGDLKAAQWWAKHKMQDQFGAPSRRQAKRMQRIQQLQAAQAKEPKSPMYEIHQKLKKEYEEGLKRAIKQTKSEL